MTWRIEPLPLHGPLFEGAIAVYGEAFARPPYSDPDRGAEVRQRLREMHGLRDGYRGLIAVADDGQIVGMCYGYHSKKGQWWHESVRAAISKDQTLEWLSDAYELVEIAVDPDFQSHGVGRQLIAALLEGRPEQTCVLSTRTDSEAHKLYSRLGFEVITEMVFAPGGAPFYVMGKRLRRA